MNILPILATGAAFGLAGMIAAYAVTPHIPSRPAPPPMVPVASLTQAAPAPAPVYAPDTTDDSTAFYEAMANDPDTKAALADQERAGILSDAAEGNLRYDQIDLDEHDGDLTHTQALAARIASARTLAAGHQLDPETPAERAEIEKEMAAPPVAAP